MKNYSKHKIPNLYINAAVELGLKYEIIDEDLGYVMTTDGKKELYTTKGSVSCNNTVAASITKDKYDTGIMLNKYGLPVPRQKMFKVKDVEGIQNYVRNNFPIVIKPSRGKGGDMVFADIPNAQALEKALGEFSKSPYKQVIVEEFVKGDDYRIIVYNNKPIDALKRIPAFVIGDGIKTVDELIAEKNKLRANLEASLIKKDSRLQTFLEKSGKSLTYIPKKDERVALRSNCNFSEGGEVERVELQSIHPDNLEAFIKARQAVGLSMCGVDFISEDISISYKENGGRMNEINSAPGILIHYIAATEDKLYVPKTILKEYFEIN